MITFAPFLIDLPREAIMEISDLCEFLDIEKVEEIKNNQLQYVDALFKSADIFHPNCRKVVITDKKTKFPKNFNFEILRLDLDPAIPMYMRMKAYMEFLSQLSIETDVVFPDTDLLFNSNLEPLFEMDFDVAMPFRYQHLNMPIICSLIIIKGKNINNAIRFFEKIIHIYKKKYSQYLTWWGDQSSIADIIDIEKRVEPEMIKKLMKDTMAIIEQDDFRLLLLENDVWNYSPPKDLAKNITFPDKKVLHFLGFKRKAHMLPYFENHIGK